MASIGILNSLVTVQQKALGAPSSTGARAVTWMPVKQVSAAIHPLTGKLQKFAETYGGTANYRITIPYIDALFGVDPSNYRVVWKGGIFMASAVLVGDLVSTSYDGTKTYLTILATQIFDSQDPDSVGPPTSPSTPATTTNAVIFDG
jgi:head-tail adaptor